MGTAKVIEPDNPRRYVRRIGDWVQEGANNTIVVLGTDRAKRGPATVDDGLGDQPGTGAVHVIAGRHDPDGNPDLDSDDAYIYLSRKTDVDSHLGLGGIVAEDSAVASAVVKSDAVRIVGRRNIKIALDGAGSYVFVDGDVIEVQLADSFLRIEQDQITLDSKRILLGAEAVEDVGRQVLGTTFIRDYLLHQHPTAVGPTGPANVVGPSTAKLADDYLSKSRLVGED